MHAQIATATFAKIGRPERVRTDGQEQRMERRKAERARNDGRKMDRGNKRAQAFA